MTDVKWIRLEIDMFDNKKIKHIRKLPEGNNIVLIWMMLLTMAGRCNSNGIIFLTENIPYTNKMLADELDFDESVIELALAVLEKFGMITRDGVLLSIPGWEEHQNIDGLDRIREQTRKRVAEHRRRQKELAAIEQAEGTVEALGTTEPAEKIEVNNLIKTGDVQKVINEWNTLQEFGIAPVMRLAPSSKRCQDLKVIIRKHGVDNVLKAIQNVRESKFLKGEVNNFIIDFKFFTNIKKFERILNNAYGNWNEDVHNGTVSRKTSRDIKPIVPLGEWNGEDSDTPFV